MQKHQFNLQSSRYFCVSLECTWSVLNHSYAACTRLTFGVLEHVYEARVETPTLFFQCTKPRKAKKREFACTYSLRPVIGLRFLYKLNSWYILWDFWKIDSNKYIIFLWKMDNSVPKDVNWRINQSKETFCSLVFISPFSFPSECSSAVPAKGCFYKCLAENLRSAVFPHENSELQTRRWIVAAHV